MAERAVNPPKAILLDLDDTILNDTGCVRACWEAACAVSAPECGIEPDILLRAIHRSAKWFWSDPERHRVGRLDLKVARAEVARIALAGFGIRDYSLAEKVGGIYHERREQGIEIFPDSVATIQWFLEQGCRLALVTNGAAEPQRNKIVRFGLASFFDSILIEGEVGFGKPDERVYRLALEALEILPGDSWMVGDNLEWDVAQPQRLGIFGVWVDGAGKGLPVLDNSVRPDRVIKRLSD